MQHFYYFEVEFDFHFFVWTLISPILLITFFYI